MGCGRPKSKVRGPDERVQSPESRVGSLGPDGDWEADAEIADAPAVFADACGGGQIRLRAGSGVVRGAGERSGFADAPGPGRQTYQRSAGTVRGEPGIGFLHAHARVSVCEEKQFQRRNLPPLWDSRADSKAGRADV